MNRALLNPFDLCDLPEKIEDFLEFGGRATCMSFNRHGNLLAMGTSFSQVVVWDFETKSVATILGSAARDPHSNVTCVAFPAPRTGVTLLAGYHSGHVRLFDTLAGALLMVLDLRDPVIQLEPHPKLPDLAVAVTPKSFPHVLRLRRGAYAASASRADGPRFPHVSRVALEPRGDISAAQRAREANPGLRAPPELPAAADALRARPLRASDEPPDARLKTPFVVRFTRSGARLLRAGPGGVVRSFALDADAVRCVAVREVPGRAAVREIVLSRRADRVLVVSLDRCLRLFHVDSLATSLDPLPGGRPVPVEPISTCTDVVNKTQCRTACFSLDGEFLLGGMSGADHKIHVWRAADGQLERTLEGPRESIVHILWHPLRPVIVSLGGNSGGIYVWERNVSENWSAFAPDFVELEANEEYVEREDEFDICDAEDDAAKTAEREKTEQKLLVDVQTMDNVAWFSSDSEGEDNFFFLPADPVTPPPVIPPMPLPRVRDDDGTRRREGNGRKRGRPTGERRPRVRTRPRVAGADANGNTSGLPNGSAHGAGAATPNGTSPAGDAHADANGVDRPDRRRRSASYDGASVNGSRGTRSVSPADDSNGAATDGGNRRETEREGDEE